MKWVIFGLSISSSWGNGHATLWRGLCRSLIRRKHRVVFFERDAPYYAEHRDLHHMPGLDLRLYSSWESVVELARQEVQDADAAIVTSYCPDALTASDLILHSRAGVRVFYDLDAPITLERIESGQRVPYIGARGLRDFDLVLSFTGGRTLQELTRVLGAKRVAPLYGSVDPEIHCPTLIQEGFACDLSYLGTYAADRQPAVEELFVKPAMALPEQKFLLGGPMYPSSFPWRENIFHIPHIGPEDHPAFYCSSRVTLNVTRAAMARLGYCPSGRLFEAAACGTPVISDSWKGLESFFEPGREILLARDAQDVIAALNEPADVLKKIGERAMVRALDEHTSEVRARELIRHVEETGNELQGRVTALPSHGNTWGIIPAAGIGSRIQPLAFSKELLPVGSRLDGVRERPRAVSEYLLERMVLAGANHLCFVISPGKSDIIEYFGGEYAGGVRPVHVAYTVQPRPAGLCDAVFRAAPLIQAEDEVIIGLPDTIWFPEEGLSGMDSSTLSLLLFPVDHPEFFDAVVMDEQQKVLEIQVKEPNARSNWIWGAMRMPGSVFLELHSMWQERDPRDEYLGNLFNAYIWRGGRVRGFPIGQSYVDVGTINGYREAIRLLMVRTFHSRDESSRPSFPPQQY